MDTEYKLVLSPIAAAVAAALTPGQAVMAQSTEGGSSGRVLEEITVTARKRQESAQEIPIAIQALSQDSLAAMGAKAMEDYARFTPSVNVVTYSNSSNVIVFRGAITGPGYIAQSTSSVYLDEISITTTGSQPGVRIVDIERVEALSGPQGTLYGSDAQAGTMRIVTNKPRADAYEAVFDGELRSGADSDPSYRGSLVFNLPLVEDTLALRLVGYNDRDGGYIDNVYGHTPDSSALPDNHDPVRYPNGFYPSSFGTLDNSASVEDKWNESDIVGLRANLLWNINDSWSATLGYTHQNTESGADNYFDPNVGDLQTVRFHDEYNDDKFDIYSLTVDADLGFAQLVSATSYYERKNSYLSDVTEYAHYWAATYCHDSAYTAAYFGGAYFENPETGYAVFWPVYCQGPSVDSDFFNAAFLHAQQDKFTQEIRLSSEGETLDWLVGLYYEESNDDWQSSFAGPTTGGDGSVSTYQDSISYQYYLWADGAVDPRATSHWYSDSKTDWEQKAIFGEVTWHMNDAMDLTFGGRYFDRSNTNYYFVNHPGGFGIPAYVEPEGRTGVDQEFIPKVSLNYMFGDTSDNKMVYGLYTRGKRPGGINRTRGEPFFPPNYVSDLMDNYEIGYKSMFAGGDGRFNVTGYHMAWSDYQLELVDPSSVQCLDGNGDPNPDLEVPGECGQPWQQVVANAGDAHITGVNVEVDYSPSENWVLGFNAEYMEAETDTSQDLNGDGEDNLVAGLRLPIVPEWKAAAWAEYHWPMNLFGNNDAWIRTQWSYSGDTFNILEPLPDTDPNLQSVNPAYTIGDLRLGLTGDTWEASIFINNITDERAQYTINTGQFEYGAANLSEGRSHVSRVFTNRPREIGVRFMKRWGG
jgi:outer membrane receptor protein involved in Fe transport